MTGRTSQHSVLSAVRQGVLVWYALLGGIGAWALHLLFLASFVRFTCNTGRYEWAEHLATVFTAGLTLAAMALCLRLVREGNDDESSDREGGRNRFIGQLGLLVGAINLALILLEGAYVVALHADRCG